MKRLFPLLLVLLFAAIPALAQPTEPLDETYYMNEGDVYFDYRSDWRVVEVEPRGSVIIADSTATLNDFVTEPGDFQISFFAPFYVVPNYGDNLLIALGGLVSDFFPGLELGEAQEVTVGEFAGLRQDFVDNDKVGFVLAYETAAGIALATVTTVQDGLDTIEPDVNALLASVAPQVPSELEFVEYTTDPIGQQNRRFTFEVPAGWATLEQGTLVLATNALSVAEFTAAEGEFLLAISPRYEGNLLMVDFPVLESTTLPDDLDPVTTALSVYTNSITLSEPPSLPNDVGVTVANVWNQPLVAMVRVVHNPADEAAALSLALTVRGSVVPALPEGFVLADVPELAFVGGIDPSWRVQLNQGNTMLITPVPVEELTEENWAMVASVTRYNDPAATFETFLEQTEFSEAQVGSGQLPTGQTLFRATIPGDDTTPIRWGITVPGRREMFLVSIFSPGGNNEATEDLLEDTLLSLRPR